MYRLPAAKPHRCSRAPGMEATCPGCTEFKFLQRTGVWPLPMVLIHATGSVAKYGQVCRTDAGAPSTVLVPPELRRCPSASPSSGLRARTFCRGGLVPVQAGSSGCCRGGEWTGEWLSTALGRLAEMSSAEHIPSLNGRRPVTPGPGAAGQGLRAPPAPPPPHLDALQG